MARTKSEAKRKAILDAAESAFVKREYDEVLTDEIASLAGVRKGTIYRHFPTKEELYSAVLLRGFDELEAAVAGIAAEPSGARERLARLCREMLRAFWTRSTLFHTVQGLGRSAGRARRELRARRNRFHALLEETLRSGLESGELRPHDPHLAAQFLIGMLRSAVVFRRPGDQVDGLAQEILAVFLRGVGAKEAP